MLFRSLWLGAVAALALVACSSDDGAPPVDQNGTVGGRVLVTQDGPLVGAQVSVDLLEYQGATPIVRRHVGDLTTDATGHFEILTGQDSGYFLVTTHGGSFVDYATGQTVALDPSDSLTALLYTDPLEDLTTGLVTPITHLAHRLIVARTTAGTDRSLVDSHTLVTAHLDQHFGGLAWERIQPASLATAATSPTAEIRAALVLAAWSMVARDVAAAAGSSVQEVNPFTLAIDLGEDIGTPPFDGDDDNTRTGGIQLGACPPPDASCIPRGGACDLGDCRSKCDAFANTPRTVLATWLANTINDNGPGGRNQTGLTAADTLSFVRAVAGNDDPILFGSACIDVAGVDLEPPTLSWGTMPTDGAVVRGSVTWTVAATDNVDPAPVVTWLGGLPDSDGAPSSAATTIDTTLAADGARSVTAHAVDESGNATDETRTIVADNTAPALTVAPSGFLVNGPDWWTALDAPHLTGMVTDAHGPIVVEARILGALVAASTFPSGAWDLALPGGTIAAAGSTVVVRAVDTVGNATVDTAATSPFLRVDGAAPMLTWDSSTAGLTLLGADYWATTATPTLTGTVNDANLASVIASWPGGMATASVAGSAWSVALAGLDLAGRDVTITATDRAGNTAALVRHLRADTTPPVAGFGITTVMQEDHDTIEFSTATVAGLRTYNPTHNHATTFPTSLGASTACDASAPSVVKFAYLLDQAPPYVTESGGTDAGGGNALKWQLAPSDDGVGLASARYRVVRVDSGAVIIDWTPLAAPTPTLVRLYRNGIAGAVGLGAAQGLLRIELETTDRLARTVTAARCWNQTLLPAPITLGTASAATTATAGKLALAGLNLATIGSPVSSMTNPANGGAGLYEFPIYNPTRETVYLSIDVSRTMTGRYTKSYYDNKWIYRDVTTNYSCNAVGTTGDWEPDYDLANCANAAPTGGSSALLNVGPAAIPPADYGVRMWAGTDDAASTLTELTLCAGCSTTPAGADPRTRVTIAIPPRGAADAPPVKVWIMPTLRASSNYQPGSGSATEFSGGGLELTGATTGTLNQCVQWNLPIPYTFAAQPTYRCTRTRQYQQVRYLKSIAITGIGLAVADAFTGLDGTATLKPSYLSGLSNRRDYLFGDPIWNTAEATEPPSL